MKSGPHVVVMLGLYAGLRREEILGLKWDCLTECLREAKEHLNRDNSSY